jgi:uncharacterized protein YciU (UPF0263 family)
MEKPANFNRPTLAEALDAWETILDRRGFPTRFLWLFEENLCFEKSRAANGGLRLGFQTRFTPPPDDALDIAFDHFSATAARMVFYRLGGASGKSACVLLCDPWFEDRGNTEGFLRRDDWKISFCPGLGDEIEEITELARWLRRVKRGRAFHDLDFCMSLATIEEIMIYGRPLAPYERFAQAMLNRLRRFLGQTD